LHSFDFEYECSFELSGTITCIFAQRTTFQVLTHLPKHWNNITGMPTLTEKL
jgi:hypothetical protein